MKELAWNVTLGEECTRSMLARFEHQLEHTGMTMEQANEACLHDWVKKGAQVPWIMQALEASPYPMQGVKREKMISLIF